jgi:hypothetical protein
MKGDAKLEQEIVALGDLPREELVARWIKAHGCSPPSGVRRELLIHSAAWHLQTRCLGGFSAETRRRLRDAVRRLDEKISRKSRNRLNDRDAATASEPLTADRSRKTRQSLSPGARLLREWNGRTYVVDAIENGFVYEGKVFRSLSAIARQITGVRWSGPRFFGL